VNSVFRLDEGLGDERRATLFTGQRGMGYVKYAVPQMGKYFEREAQKP
jgi:hypothetical protein